MANNILKDTYLAEDAVHQSFMGIIKQKKERTFSFNDFEFALGERAVTKEVFHEDNQIIAAISSLPLNYSSVLMLKYSQGYADNEIANILVITEDNVWRRIV